jgi:CHAT domain-containing protein
MSERQRGLYFNTVSSYFQTGYSLSQLYPVATVNGVNYNNTLFTKGLLLRTTTAVREAVYSSGDASLIKQYEQLGSLRQQISQLQQREDADRAYLQSLEDRADNLDKILTQASAAYLELKEDMAMQWEDVQRHLQLGEAALEFVSFLFRDNEEKTNGVVYAALVLRRGMEAPAWVPLCEETVLDDIFREADGKSPREQISLLYDTKGRDLYAAVWQPLENLLEGVTSVYYSPSGLLHKVSFNAIPAGDLRLTDKYELNLVSSTREVVYLKNKTAETSAGVAAGSRSAVVYGGLRYDIDENTMRDEALAYNLPETEKRIIAALPASLSRGGRGGWGYLIGTERERSAVQGMLTANGVPHVVYSGAGGNEESFKALNGGRRSVIHLATHGFFIEDIEKSNDDRELLQRVGGGQRAFENPLLRSGLILAGGNRAWANDPVDGVEDGILFADEVARINLLGAELVVLSACETGLGDLNNSEGVFGLQRAFKLAGAETIVMSLWEVDDRATVMLMEQFYRNWLSGKSKQEAMKDAQRSLRAEGRFAPPYFWAAFVLMD